VSRPARRNSAWNGRPTFRIPGSRGIDPRSKPAVSARSRSARTQSACIGRDRLPTPLSPPTLSQRSSPSHGRNQPPRASVRPRGRVRSPPGALGSASSLSRNLWVVLSPTAVFVNHCMIRKLCMIRNRPGAESECTMNKIWALAIGLPLTVGAISAAAQTPLDRLAPSGGSSAHESFRTPQSSTRSLTQCVIFSSQPAPPSRGCYTLGTPSVRRS
jgi:hypothetical protein